MSYFYARSEKIDRTSKTTGRVTRGVKSLRYFNKLRGKLFGRANPKKPVSAFWIMF